MLKPTNVPLFLLTLIPTLDHWTLVVSCTRTVLSSQVFSVADSKLWNPQLSSIPSDSCLNVSLSQTCIPNIAQLWRFSDLLGFSLASPMDYKFWLQFHLKVPSINWCLEHYDNSTAFISDYIRLIWTIYICSMGSLYWDYKSKKGYKSLGLQIPEYSMLLGAQSIKPVSIFNSNWSLTLQGSLPFLCFPPILQGMPGKTSNSFA